MMEFQAVVFAAGKGSRITELTTSCPKPFLPVGNLPMVCYPLKMLEKAGFQEVIVIVEEKNKREMVSLAEQHGISLRLDVVEIPASEEWGTADSLRHIAGKIKVDILCISCDTITDVPLYNVVDLHRKHGSSVTALFTRTPDDLISTSVPGRKNKEKPERDLVGIEPSSSRLLFLSSEADYTDNFTVHMSLFRKFSHIKVHNKLTDAHLYILKKGVVDYLVTQKHFFTLKGDLIPHILKQQQFRNKNSQLNGASEEKKKGAFQFAGESELDRLAREKSCWTDNDGEVYHGDSIRCYAYINEDHLCLRANTMGSYCELNRLMSRHLEPPLVDCAAKVLSKQVGSECIVGKDTVIQDKSSVKRSVIGNHCKVASKVKINNCVIMDHVSIEEGASVTGSIVCSNANIESLAVVKDCVIGDGQTAHSGGKFSNEVIAEMSTMMEL